MSQSIKNITEDISNSHLSYVTHEDICSCFKGDTLLAIQAPNGTQLEVPIPDHLESGQKRYQIHLKSSEGQIYVLLVNKDAESAEPVVVQVPPPKEVADAINREQETEVEVEKRRVGGRGKVKASSPPAGEEVKAKKVKEEAADNEVENILGRANSANLTSDIPGLEELISTESKFQSHF